VEVSERELVTLLRDTNSRVLERQIIRDHGSISESINAKEYM